MPYTVAAFPKSYHCTDTLRQHMYRERRNIFTHMLRGDLSAHILLLWPELTQFY